ncbi:MAG TPA: MBOAT family protein [Lentisphaeria bacterium]|nr:MAG: hypothetical protein A2X48_18335 [Lentisphaerae bacterium GWF2_49_21]HBC87138.1 MBOAT family protein [Lentisphaeria bacterium]
MLFTQIEFFILFAGVIIFLLLVKNHRAQKIFLLLFSYYFYAYWDWRFLFLLLGSTCIDYTIGIALEKSKSPVERKFLIVASLITNLGVLCLFKYFNFFIDNLRPILESFGFRPTNLSLILPIGISFYTFQSLSYTIDVYRRTIKPCKDFFDLALCIAFFPQLVAGPIVRASYFMPQIRRPREMTLLNAYYGFRLVVYGLFKKVFIADNIAMFVDDVFGKPGMYSCTTTWLAVLAYAVQIYCDFSGYSDMAIGMARIMGYKFRMNFNLPYISSNMSEFWQRWHISLSSWLRDYLYISLGGNRLGTVRTYVNLMLTMLLGGLWHGAAWTFILWGALHGAALAVQRIFSFKRLFAETKASQFASSTLGWALTFFAVLIGWVFFRSQGFTASFLTLRQMFFPSEGIIWYHPFVIGVIIAMFIFHLVHALEHEKIFHLGPFQLRSPAILFTMLWLIIVFHPKTFNPFIYFQF